MKLFNFSDRRRDGFNRGGGRGWERRKGERRRFFRVYYPPNAAPNILNGEFRIINISQEAITFACLKRCDRCSQPVPIGETIIIQIEFHDGERLDVKLRIIRAQGDLRTRENLYAGLAEEGISAERIAKEQAYLLRQYPDFARASRARSLERMQATVQEPQK